MTKVKVSLLAMAHLVQEIQPGFSFGLPDAFEELYLRLDAWIEAGDGRNVKSARAVWVASRLGLTTASFPRAQLPSVGLPTTLPDVPEHVIRIP